MFYKRPFGNPKNIPTSLCQTYLFIYFFLTDPRALWLQETEEQNFDMSWLIHISLYYSIIIIINIIMCYTRRIYTYIIYEARLGPGRRQLYWMEYDEVIWRFDCLQKTTWTTLMLYFSDTDFSKTVPSVMTADRQEGGWGGRKTKKRRKEINKTCE